MWWLWILAGIFVLLIVAVLFIPIVLTFRFDGSPLGGEVWLRHGFLKKQLLPRPTKDKPKKKPKKQTQTEANKSSKNPVGSLVKEHGPVEAVSMMVETATALLSTVKTLLKGAKIRRFKGVFRIGGQDAAQAATRYGQVCAVLYPFLGLISSLMTFTNPDLQVWCDYDSQESEIHASGEIHISPLRMPVAAGHAFRYLINKNLKKGGK